MTVKETDFREEVLGLLLLLAVMIWAAWEARTFPSRAGIFPQVIALGASVLLVVELVRVSYREFRGQGRGPQLLPPATPKGGRAWVHQLVRARRSLLAMGGYVLAIFVFGFLPASFLFVVVFLIHFAGDRWVLALLGASTLLAALVMLGRLLRLAWHEGWLVVWLGLA